jgi:Zn-dependent protease with chaperone function
MTAPYFLRLLYLCLAAFFVIHTAAGLMVALATQAAVCAAQRMCARRAAGFLLALRLLPPALALLLVGGVCVPSYLLLEQEASAEEVGWLCLAAALLSACLWSASLARSWRAAVRSARHSRDWERTGSPSKLPGGRRPVWVVDSPAPLLALAGVFRPRLVISRPAAAALSPAQLCAALRHEEAHRRSRDNLKRLLLLLAPGLLPGWHGFHALECAWTRFAEWAADDAAAAGNPRRSLSLAAALVRIARMGGAPPALPLSVGFLADGRDLKARVDRLLRPAMTAPAAQRVSVIPAAVALALVFVAVSLHPATLESAHRLLEGLMH